MTPRLRVSALRDVSAWEYAIRFPFGGVVTLATGLVAHAYGPSIGGLFLAFPAILPASLTLVQLHDGRRDTVDDARGARLGTLGLIGFAAVVWSLSGRWPAVAVLGLATIAWTVAATTAWAVVYGGARRAR